MKKLPISLLALIFFASLGCAQQKQTPSEKSVAPSSPSAPTTSMSEIPGKVLPSMGSPNIGEMAPNFELTDQKGEKVTLASLKGSLVVMQFGASFCPFSKAELPNLKKLAEEYADKNVKVLLVDVKEGNEEYKEYSSRLPVPFPVLRDKTGKVAESYMPSKAQPGMNDRAMAIIASNLILDKEGKIRFFTLLDSMNFDAELVHLRADLDHLIGKGGAS
jgi:peroxiredoxin